MKWILWVVIALCFLEACVTDCRTREVYNVTWWISGAAAAVLLVWSGEAERRLLQELFLFWVIQMTIFSKLYGKADCYAFCVCAAAEASEGMGLREYLLHMAAAFALLTVVQLLRRNVDGRGNLKRAVPFLPYITLAFALLLLMVRYEG